jgi:hypothetical protein
VKKKSKGKTEISDRSHLEIEQPKTTCTFDGKELKIIDPELKAKDPLYKSIIKF